MLPRVWLAPMGRDWSYDFTARALAKHLAHRFEIRVAYTDTVQQVADWPADLYVDFWWKGTLHRTFGRRVVKQVSSHRWKQRRYHSFNVRQLASKYLRPCGAIVVPSVRLRDELSATSTPPIAVCPKGFHPELMGDYGMRRGPLVVGWAGTAKAADKNVPMIVQAYPDVRLADRCLTQGEMSDFYNSIDVITNMSVAEGDPRPLIEGMACGCFPVMVDVGIVPELVRHGENGLVVKRTPEALAEALAWCRDNIDFVRAAGRRNAEQMLATRTWVITSRAWGDAFDAALARIQQQEEQRVDAAATAEA